MTDTATSSAPSFAGAAPKIIEMYNVCMATISEIDGQLELAGGGKAAGKRATLNRLVSENEDKVDEVVKQVANFLDTLDPQESIGVFTGIVKKLKTTYDPKVEVVLEDLSKDVPDTPPLADEEVNALASQRSVLYKQINSVRDMLDMLGENLEEFPPAKRRGGGRGKRGKRAISLYTWTLDGEKLEGEEDSLNAISKKLGYDKSVMLRTAMKESGLDLSTPPDPIDFELTAENSPDGSAHRLHGEKKITASEDDEDENGEEDDDDDEEVEETE